MRWLLSCTLALAAAVALGGQSTIPPVVMPPKTLPTGPAKPPQRPPVTVTPKAIPYAQITGRVLDNNGRAVDAATVFLVGLTSVQKASTDSRGRFAFTGIVSGDYVVVARKRGFYDGAFGKRRAAGTPLPVSVAAGQAMSDMQIELFRYGVITGSVRDEANEPVIGARVVAVRRFFAGGDWKYAEAGSAMTDDQGAYRVYGLEPGEYLVITPTTQITLEIPEDRIVAGGLPNTEDTDLAYPTLFYASSRYSQLALPLHLTSGEVRYAVNFQWAPVPARSVSGRLIGDRGNAADQIVTLVPLEGQEIGLGHEVAITVSAPDGSFSFERVPAGDYRLEAGSAFGPPRLVNINAADASAANDTWGRMPLTVVDEDIKNIEVRMQTGRAVSGVIESSGSKARIDGRVSVVIVPSGPGLSRATAPPVANSEFTSVPLIPGQYYVRVTSLPAGWYLKGITVDGDDALDLPARLGDVNDPEIVISLTDQPTTITGSVRDSRSLLASGATVVVMPASAVQWSPNRARQTRASMNGLFEITGLPAGEYLIVAFDDASADGLQDERVLAQLRTLGTRVSLRNQESRTMHLKLSSVKR